MRLTDIVIQVTGVVIIVFGGDSEDRTIGIHGTTADLTTEMVIGIMDAGTTISTIVTIAGDLVSTSYLDSSSDN